MGVATLVFSKYFINGESTTIAYATDLRVAQNREAIVNWAPLFLEAFETACKKRNCDYIFSTVERHESQAYNALVRPQRGRRRMPRYYLFWKMYQVSIHGTWPFQQITLPGLTISTAQYSELDEIAAYLSKKTQGKILAQQRTVESLLWQLAHWPNFNLDDFLLARNSKGYIIGCLSTWNPQSVQKIKVIQYKGSAETFRQSLNFGKLVGLTHKLPDQGSSFDLRYINHLQFDNPDVFSHLLYDAWKRTAPTETLVYTCFRGDYSSRPPKGFISSRIPLGFYSILPPEKELPEFLRPNPWASPPDFEMVNL